MDDKFRVSFYPKDTTRVKVVAFPRKVAIILSCIILPLALMGVWLVFAGTLHEPREEKIIRRHLSEENRALRSRVGQLDEDLKGLRGDLTHLEDQKVNALMISGVEYMDGEKRSKTSSLFSFFHGRNRSSIDVGESLRRAKIISAYFDTTLRLLHDQGQLVESLPTSYPVSAEAIITREFGYSPDPFTGRKALHAGVDFSLRAGAPVFASGGGTVEMADKDLLWGNCVKIDHGRGVESFYAHLQDVMVKRGQKVARGEAIGTMGMSGVASGVHLHYELTVHNAKADPMNYFLPELVLGHGPSALAPARGPQMGSLPEVRLAEPESGT